QAEDGIRDRTVTGVQTCALPISSLCRRPAGADECCARSRSRGPVSCVRSPTPRERGRWAAVRRWFQGPPPSPQQPRGKPWLSLRSEERRVGKEGRAGWGKDRERK